MELPISDIWNCGTESGLGFSPTSLGTGPWFASQLDKSGLLEYTLFKTDCR